MFVSLLLIFKDRDKLVNEVYCVNLKLYKICTNFFVHLQLQKRRKREKKKWHKISKYNWETVQLCIWYTCIHHLKCVDNIQKQLLNTLWTSNKTWKNSSISSTFTYYLSCPPLKKSMFILTSAILCHRLCDLYLGDIVTYRLSSAQVAQLSAVSGT